MARTKAEIRAAIREEIDDPNGARWSNTNLDMLTSFVYDEMWMEMLDVSPWLRTTTQTITPLTAPGYINTASGGALTGRLYKIQKIVRNTREYAPIPNEYIVLEDNAVVVPTIYSLGYFAFYGDQLWLFPLELTPEVEVTYNSLPADYTTLADGATVSWRDGHEAALILEVAARALTKGDAESMAQKRQLAEAAKMRLMSSLSRRHTLSREPKVPDSPAWYGG